ncbi:hypothetical protein M0R01_00600 [bacterium]|nr:hypothetical protein [bacterium]
MNLLNISKKISYLFLFLLPFFFIPNSVISPVMNQKAVVLIFVLISTALFSFIVIKNKENSLNFGILAKISLLFLFFSSISLLISGYIFQGYWGYAMQSDTLFCLVLFFFLFFLFSNIFNSQNRERAYGAFALGSFFLALLYIFQIFWGSKMQIQMILPVNTEASIIFALGLIFSIYYIFENFDFKKNKKNQLRLLGTSIAVVIFIVMLYLMGIKLGWFLSSIGIFFLFWNAMQKREFDFNSPEPFISFLFVLFFLVNFLLPLNDLPLLKAYAYSEPVITYDQSINIISETLNSPTKIALGTGPASFPYNFSLNKGESFGADSNIPNHPNSGFFMIINNFGILGGLIFLSLFLFFLWKTISFMLGSGKGEKDELLFVSSVFVLFLAFFFYRFSFLITSLLFVFLGLHTSNLKKYELLGGENRAYQVVILLIFLASLYNIYFFAQYQAEQKYSTFVMLSSESSKYEEIFTEDQSLDNYINLLDESLKTFPNPDYAVYLSKTYLSKSVKIYDDYFDPNSDGEENVDLKKQSFDYLSRSENYAKMAVAMNERNFFAWENLGMIYENIEKIDSSKVGQAIISYQKAQSLAPYNYEVYVLMGRKLEKEGKKSEALEYYKKGLKLNPEFTELKEVINAIEKSN